jgi:hypothetical protein
LFSGKANDGPTDTTSQMVNATGSFDDSLADRFAEHGR